MVMYRLVTVWPVAGIALKSAGAWLSWPDLLENVRLFCWMARESKLTGYSAQVESRTF